MKNIVYIYTMAPVEIIKLRADGCYVVRYDSTSIIACHPSELLFLN